MRFPLSILLIFFLNALTGQNIPKIDSIIKDAMLSEDVAAIAVAVIDSGKIVHLSADGFRDIENNLKASINSPFQIASVSKTVTNMAVFKLVESGQVDLDSDINNYLPFTVKNPHYPDDSITVSDLLNHRSGIRDNMDIYEEHWNIPKGDPTISLHDFMKDYLVPDGKLYHTEHYESAADYNQYAYSNTGAALLGLIVEHVSGMQYKEFCQEKIFNPMGMEDTGWFLADLDQNEVAKSYAIDDSLGLVFKGFNGYPDYPGGQLRTSISDYSKLITGYLNAENEHFILKKETTLQITPESSRAVHEGFYTWFITPINDRLYYSHSGGDVGVRTISFIDVRNKRSIILFLNSEYWPSEIYKNIEKKMWGQ